METVWVVKKKTLYLNIKIFFISVFFVFTKATFAGWEWHLKGKKTMSSEGPVKIVGINHGVCLHHFLLMDGWKEKRTIH